MFLALFKSEMVKILYFKYVFLIPIIFIVLISLLYYYRVFHDIELNIVFSKYFSIENSFDYFNLRLSKFISILLFIYIVFMSIICIHIEDVNGSWDQMHITPNRIHSYFFIKSLAVFVFTIIVFLASIYPYRKLYLSFCDIIMARGIDMQIKLMPMFGYLDVLNTLIIIYLFIILLIYAFYLLSNVYAYIIFIISLLFWNLPSTMVFNSINKLFRFEISLLESYYTIFIFVGFILFLFLFVEFKSRWFT